MIQPRLLASMFVVLAAIVGPAVAQAQVAKFVVEKAEVDKRSNKVRVTILWTYNAGGGGGYSGRGVRFFLHRHAPNYGQATSGTLVGTVNMTNGTGRASFLIDPKDYSASAGSQFHLAGKWSSGHEWGSTGRPGGFFTVPPTWREQARARSPRPARSASATAARRSASSGTSRTTRTSRAVGSVGARARASSR